MRKMGGLIRKMPVTAVTFLVGVLAIAGVGIPAVWMPGHTPFGLGGYFSKDEILAVAWHRVYGENHGENEVAPGAEIQNPKSRIHNAEAAALRPEPRTLNPLLFWIPVLMAYVTPFYMMRCWWLTFMGKPRDHHVHEHAHESPLMYVPLVVLALGTFVSSYYLFRPLVAAAAPHPFLTVSYDGAAAEAAEAHATMISHGAHAALATRVGLAFAVGFVLAWLIYRKGLAVGEKLAVALKPAYTVLVHKFYFDELYGFVLIGGTMALNAISYAFDKFVVDGLVNLSAFVTERLSWFSGMIVDQGVVDGMVNGVGRGTWTLGGLVRSPQVGRIRNYILFAATGVAVVVLWIAFV